MSEFIEDKKDITFRISGSEMIENDGYNLFYLVESLDCFQTLVEKTYLLTERKRKMSYLDREQLKVKAFNIREGSFIVDLAIFIKDATISLTPLLTAVNPEDMWSLIAKAYEYLKVVLTAKKRGEEVYMEISNSTGSYNIKDVHGDVIINNITPDALELAKLHAPIYKRMSNLISDDDQIGEITMTDETNGELREIKLDKEDKSLFENKVYVSDDRLIFSGKITKANSYNATGKIEVLESEDELDVGTYSFEFIEKDVADDVFKNSFTIVKEFTAYKRVSFDPSSLEETIIGLKIINILE